MGKQGTAIFRSSPAIEVVARKLGIGSPETLWQWIREAEVVVECEDSVHRNERSQRRLRR